MYLLEMADFSVQSYTCGQAEGWPNIYGKHSQKCPVILFIQQMFTELLCCVNTDMNKSSGHVLLRRQQNKQMWKRWGLRAVLATEKGSTGGESVWH